MEKILSILFFLISSFSQAKDTQALLCVNLENTSKIKLMNQEAFLHHRTEVLIYGGAYMHVNSVDLDTGAESHVGEFEIGYFDCESTVVGGTPMPGIIVSCSSRENPNSFFEYRILAGKKSAIPNEVDIQLMAPMFEKPIKNRFSCKLVNYNKKVKKFKN